MVDLHLEKKSSLTFKVTELEAIGNTPFLYNQKNGHSEVPMTDIDSKTKPRYFVHYQPQFCINSSWKYVSI